MKNVITLERLKVFILLAGIIFCTSVFSQSSSKDKKIVEDAQKAKAAFIKTDALMSNLFNSAHGYAIFPNVGKGGIGVGGAAGNGAVYENGVLIGMAKMTQATIGFQWGGQAYREVIFFENKNILDNFRASRFEFSAQASAVAVTVGASGNAKYKNGVMIFTQEKGGLMYEASVGGQKFKFNKL
jgi:lipid-binding SYLF domain-containing protein